MRTIASVGCWMRGSGTVSTRTSRFPCQVTAFMRPPYPGSRARMLRLSGLRPALRADQDLRHHGTLGLAVVVRRVPVPARQLALGLLVELPIRRVVAEPVAEQQPDPRALAVLGEDVDVDVLVGRPVHAVAGLAHADVEAVALERRAVGGLVVGVVDGDHHVDDALGAKAGDGGGAEVLDAVRRRPERLLQRGVDLLEAGRPRGVVLLDDDRALLRSPDEDRVVHHAGTTSGSYAPRPPILASI